jgi:two-component sensor histidine kinase
LPNIAAFQQFDFPTPRAVSLMSPTTDEFWMSREMRHRLANALSVLTSLCRREFFLSASPESKYSLARYDAKIVALENLPRSLAAEMFREESELPSGEDNREVHFV